MIWNIILSDTYLGIFWWGKKKRTTSTVSVVENGVRTYRKKVKREERPREEWTAIPEPDSGIPPEIIARARNRIEKNTWTPSRNSGWDLGTLRWYSGVRALWFTSQNPHHLQRREDQVLLLRLPQENIQSGQRYLPQHKALPCRDPGVAGQGQPLGHSPGGDLADFVDKTYNRRMEDLRKMHRFDPSKTRERLLKRIDSLETKMTRLVDLFTDGDISKETYR